MKRLIALCLALGVALTAAAQQKRDFLKEYEEFKRRSLQQYDDFRDRANAAYEKFMREAWEKHDAQQAEPLPERPEPPKPVVKEPDTEPSHDVVPIDNVIIPPAPVVPPQPAMPIPVPDKMPDKNFRFKFYGTPCAVPLEAKHRFALRGTDENSVADGWGVLSSDDYLPVISECLNLRSRLHLCDWGYVRLVERMTMEFLGAQRQNEARLMQMFILTQSGYKVRIARAGDKLVLLLPSKETIYEYPYLAINGDKFYITDPSLMNGTFMVFNREFPKERYFSIQMPEEPLLAESMTEPRVLKSERYPALSVEVSLNRNLIDFYDDYPLHDRWHIYAAASLSAGTKEQLYPVFEELLSGISKADAANKLLNFVQTAFEYKTDAEQFGQERPFFADETLYYPYSDCEDRAILYSILVHDLLGLEVVLLHYPVHLATAVSFGVEEVDGDYMELEGRRYIVCDPTYIGASIGDTMPQFKQTAAKIVKIGW